MWRVGVGGFAEPETVVDCGNSGTGVRLIMGAMATTPINVTFTGDHSLNSRPMGRVTDPLSKFGVATFGVVKVGSNDDSRCKIPSLFNTRYPCHQPS